MGLFNPASITAKDLHDFGDGKDGNIIFDVDTDLLPNMRYQNVVVMGGVTLRTMNNPLIVKDTLRNNGIISANGLGNVAQPVSFLGAGMDGAPNAVGAGGLGMGEVSLGVGGQGGNGGDGSVNPGGAGGVSETDPGQAHVVTILLALCKLFFGFIFQVNNSLRAGAGGGAGGGNGVGFEGGYGGAGAGLLTINAKVINNDGGSFLAQGEPGQNGIGGNSGGGGGGGGGRITVFSTSPQNGTLYASGGINGMGSLGGTNGTAGTDGVIDWTQVL
ncbi:MAG: hypothetical protein WC356_07185 [Candidatus Micrarchaeia archaeon]|jgi:hypothetical protein